MNKQDITRIRLDIICDNQSVLSMLLDRDGRVSRQGNGSLPADEFAVMSEGDGSIFGAIVDALDERVFEHVGLYEHPNKKGLPITYSVAFRGEDSDAAAFEFRLGTETEDVGELLPFFVEFIAKTMAATDSWYEAEKSQSEKEGEAQP